MRRMIIFASIGLLSLVIGIGLAYTLYKQWVYRNAEPVSFPEISLSPDSYPQAIVWEMIGKVDKDRALVDLRRLTGAEPVCIHSECYSIKNRLTGSEGLRWAKDYVYEILTDLGYSVERQNWTFPGYADQNIIASKPGGLHPEESIYFVAHLDGKPFTPGADDNASGVVALLELARVFSGYSLNRTVVLLFTTGEEQAAFGIRRYLDQLSPTELGAIRYAVNVDMIGYDGNRDGIMELWHGGHPPSQALTQMMGEIILAYQLDLKPGFVVGCG